MKKSFGAKTLAYPLPTWCIGSYDKEGKPNVMTIAWGGICCSNPPAVTISLRKATYTYGNILERKAFTVNVPSEKHVREADYFGLVSGKNTDKFAATGLTPVRSQLVDAPYVEEFPMIIECRLLQTVELGLHTMFVGEIADVLVDDGVLSEKGLPDVFKVAPIVYATEIRKYVGLGKELADAFSIGKSL